MEVSNKVVLPLWLAEMLDDIDGDVFNGGYLSLLHDLWAITDEAEEEWINRNLPLVLSALEDGYIAERTTYYTLLEATQKMLDGDYYACEDSERNDYNAVTYRNGQYLNKVGHEVLLDATEILSTQWRKANW